MRIGLQNTFTADEGKHFVLTYTGYMKTPQKVRPEREIGKPVKGFETSVPRSWITMNLVKETMK